MNSHVKRIKQELAFAVSEYSSTKSGQLDQDDGLWVVILDFPLPPGYNAHYVDILISLPPSYPNTPPNWFYVDPLLAKADGSPPGHFYGLDKAHIHPNQAPHRKGWAGQCIHITEGWRPGDNPVSGHNLRTVCKLIDAGFRRWR